MNATICINKSIVRALCALVSTDETRYVINGLYFTTVGDRLITVATNGRMLAVVNVSHPHNRLPAEPFEVIVPKPRLLPEKLEVEECAPGDPYVVGEEAHLQMILTIKDGQAFWQDYDGMEIVGTLINGRFPDWRAAIRPTQQAAGEPVLPMKINPTYHAHAMAVIQAFMDERSVADAVSVYPARGEVGNNSCAHVFRPSLKTLRDEAIVVLMPMKSKDGTESEEPAAEVIPAWMLAA